ncbi:hypothetical protein D3C74_55070 [compost metagenome]
MDLYIDMSKALNTAELVKKPVQVKGKMGKTFTRMQWVSTDTGQPVAESGHSFDDSHHARVRHMSDDDKTHAAQSFLQHDTERAHKFAQATGMRRNPAHLPPQSVIQHLKDNLDKIPQDHIEPHFKTHLKDDGLAHPKLGLRHQDHKLPDAEVDKRTGKDGPLDLSDLHEGTAMESVKDLWFGDPDVDKAAFKSIFGNVSKEGFEKVFSDPEGSFRADVHSIDSYMDGKDRKTHVGMDLLDGEGKRMGQVMRTAWRDQDGVLNIKNVEFELHSEHQGKGIAQKIYNQSEQYWRHLSGGNALNIHLDANISIGVYAWAKKGFDFANESELNYARKEFSTFCAHNGLDTKEVLSSCGVNDIKDLKHSWDFASLDDGNQYDLTSLITSVRDEYKNEVSGVGNFGKAFMLGGKDTWRGIKKLNQEADHEKISDHFNSKVGD